MLREWLKGVDQCYHKIIPQARRIVIAKQKRYQEEDFEVCTIGDFPNR